MRLYKNMLFALIVSLITFPTSIFSADLISNGLDLTSPTNGECLKGGSLYDIQWKPGITGERLTLNDHFGIVYLDDGSTFPLPQNDFVGDDGLTYIADSNSLNGTSYQWKVPSKTTANGMLYIEHHYYSELGPFDGPKEHRAYPDAGNGAFSKVGPFFIDNSNPTKPALTIKSKTETSASLSWTSSTDEGCKGLSGYKVYRDNKLIATLSSNKVTYEDQGLTADKAYSYKVSAFDDFTSTDSTIIKATTNKPSEPATNTTAEQSLPYTSNDATVIRFGNTNYTSKDLVSSIPKVMIGENIHLEGAAAPGAVLILTIHSKEQTFETKADQTGKWQYDISTNNLETGNHTITLASKDSAGTVGADKEIAQFALVDPVSTGDSSPESNTKKSFPIWGWIIISLIALLIAGGIVALLIRKHKKLQKSNNIQNNP